MQLKNTTKYDDILYRAHPVSKKHPQMPLADRAAQFSPFAALTGHEAAIKETARLTDERIELDENSKNLLNEQFQSIKERIVEKPEILVTYFQSDERKEGGSYLTYTGQVRKIDEYGKAFVMEDGKRIQFEEIIQLEITE